MRSSACVASAAARAIRCGETKRTAAAGAGCALAQPLSNQQCDSRAAAHSSASARLHAHWGWATSCRRRPEPRLACHGEPRRPEARPRRAPRRLHRRPGERQRECTRCNSGSRARRLRSARGFLVRSTRPLSALPLTPRARPRATPRPTPSPDAVAGTATEQCSAVALAAAVSVGSAAGAGGAAKGGVGAGARGSAARRMCVGGLRRRRRPGW